MRHGRHTVHGHPIMAAGFVLLVAVYLAIKVAQLIRRVAWTS